MKKSASSATTMYQVHKQAHSPPLRRLCLQPGWSSALIQQGVVQSVPLALLAIRVYAAYWTGGVF